MPSPNIDWLGTSAQKGRRVFVIAEIGKNFIQTKEDRPVEEYLENAIKLVKAAKDAGVDAVKFQTHEVSDEQADIEVVAPHFNGADRYSWVKRNTLSTPVDGFWKPLKAACDKMDVLFFTTPMSRGAAEKIAPLEPAMWKVGSGDMLDFVLLDYLRRSGRPIIFSAGMSTLEETDSAVSFVREKTADFALLHCVSRYPCPPEDLNLGTIGFFRERYGVPVGFSDHSIGIESALGGVALGACIIEKHFSFDRGLWGSDHKVSLTPEEMKRLVEGIRRIEADDQYSSQVLNSESVIKGMGEKGKILEEGEAVFRPLFRKTLVASRDLPEGTLLKSEDVFALRPQAHLEGLPSEKYPEVLGKKISVAVRKYQPIKEQDINP